MNGRDAAAEAGVSYRQLDHWALKGYLGKRLGTPVGSGISRDFSSIDIYKLRLMGELVRAFQMHPSIAATVASYIQEHPAGVITAGQWRLTRVASDIGAGPAT